MHSYDSSNQNSVYGNNISGKHNFHKPGCSETWVIFTFIYLFPHSLIFHCH